MSPNESTTFDRATPRLEPELTAGRMVAAVFGLDQRVAGQAAAAWSTGVGQLWVSDALVHYMRNDAPSSINASRLTDSQSLSGMHSMARSATGSGTLIGLRGADGSLLAALAADDIALHQWRRAALSVPFGLTNPGRVMVDRLLNDGRFANAATLPVSTAPVQWPQTSTLTVPAVSALLFDHLVIRLRDLDASLIHPLGAAAASLDRIDRTGGDLRLHLPPPTSRPAPLPPDPASDESGLRRWLLAQVGPGRFAPSRLLASIHAARADLSDAFPDLSVEYWQIAFWRWVEQFGADPDLGAGLPNWAVRPPLPVPAADAPPKLVSRLDKGVQVVGYLEAALGLGEAARLSVRGLELAGESIESTSYRHVVSPPVAFKRRVRPGQAPPDIQLICLAGAALTRWNRGQVPTAGPQPYRIGLWFWETDSLSPSMAASLPIIDEVWVTSAYSALAVENSTPTSMPVRIVPLGVGLPAVGSGPTTIPPNRLGTSGTRSERRRVVESCTELRPFVDRRWCGFSFDLSSRLVRKNPLGLITAWRSAFPAPGYELDDPVLVVKTVNGSAQPELLRELRSAMTNREDMVLIQDPWSTTAHHNFIRALSLYASLHRSEGYGLVLLEAMASGVPVLATGATGNMEFMDESCAWLVPAVPMMLSADEGPYPKGSSMFEPDHRGAAELLGKLFSSEPGLVAERMAKAAAAQARVAPLTDGSAAATWMARRLAEIRSNR